MTAESKKNNPTSKKRIGVFVCHCGKNIASYLDVEKVTEETTKLPNVDHAEHIMFVCSEDSCKKIKEAVEEKNRRVDPTLTLVEGKKHQRETAKYFNFS